MFKFFLSYHWYIILKLNLRNKLKWCESIYFHVFTKKVFFLYNKIKSWNSKFKKKEKLGHFRQNKLEKKERILNDSFDQISSSVTRFPSLRHRRRERQRDGGVEGKRRGIADHRPFPSIASTGGLRSRLYSLAFLLVFPCPLSFVLVSLKVLDPKLMIRFKLLFGLFSCLIHSCISANFVYLC